MFKYFIKNRHGVISIMLAIILTAILSFSSVLVEIGRYRSVRALFNEMTDNALFSTLAQYDNDLYERFGLLAMTNETDVNTYMKYLTENMNLSNEDLILVDNMLQNLEVEDFDKIYDLQNWDVLKGQILECAKYRSVEESINDITGLEDALGELIEEFEKAIPMLNLICNVCEAGEAIVELIISEIELCNICLDYRSAKSSYDSAMSAYNQAVQDRDEYMENHSSDETSDDYDENYQDTLSKKNENVSTEAGKLKEYAEALVQVLSNYKEKIDEFNKAYEKLMNKGIMSIILEARTELDSMSGEEKKSMEDFLDEMEESFESGSKVAEKLKDEIDKIKDENFIEAGEKLNEQIKELEKVVADGAEGKEMTAVAGVNGIIFTVVSIILNTMDVIMRLEDDTREGLTQFKKLYPILEMIMTERMVFNTQYNNEYLGELPSQNQSACNYDFTNEDEGTIASALSRNTEIAQMINYNTANINPQIDAEWQEINSIFNSVASSAAEFVKSAKNVNVLWDLIEVLKALWELATNLIKLASIFIVKGASEIARIIYTHLELGIYATSMFPNRTSEDDDENLLGNSWSDYKKYWADDGWEASLTVDTDNFSLARAEYIYAGSRSEIVNQTAVYNMIFFLRYIGNFIPVLLNKEVMDVIKPIMEIPIIGVVVAVLIVMVLMLAETMADMIVLIPAKESVPLVKMDMYLSADGIDDFMKKMEKILDLKEKDKQEKEAKLFVDGSLNKAVAKKMATEAGSNVLENIISWDYEMYLTFFITMQPSDVVVARCADLIQMEMVAMKKDKLEGTPFKLNEMYTCVRVETKAKYSPILPIPSVSGANNSTLDVSHISYAGY